MPGPVIQIFHLIFPLLSLFQCHGARPSGMIVNHPFRICDPEHASKLELSRLRMGKLRMAHQNAHKIPESKSQTRLPSTITRSVVNRHCDSDVSDSQKA